MAGLALSWGSLLETQHILRSEMLSDACYTELRCNFSCVYAWTFLLNAVLSVGESNHESHWSSFLNNQAFLH